MNNNLSNILEKCTQPSIDSKSRLPYVDQEKFARLLIEEVLKEVDERCYGRGENQWYYEDDKKWIRMYFLGGKLL
jgi:hypothetical protein